METFIPGILFVGLTVVYSRNKQNKAQLMVELERALSTGGKFWGARARKSKVLHLPHMRRSPGQQLDTVLAELGCEVILIDMLHTLPSEKLSAYAREHGVAVVVAVGIGDLVGGADTAIVLRHNRLRVMRDGVETVLQSS